MAADRGQSGHQAHIFEMCLPAERSIDMDTGKEVLFALPLFKLISPSTPLGVSVETTTGQHLDVIANFPAGFFHSTFQPSGGRRRWKFLRASFFFLFEWFTWPEEAETGADQPENPGDYRWWPLRPSCP